MNYKVTLIIEEKRYNSSEELNKDLKCLISFYPWLNLKHIVSKPMDVPIARSKLHK